MMRTVLDSLIQFWPALAALVVSAAVLAGAHRLLLKRWPAAGERGDTLRQLAMLGLGFGALLAVVLTLPLRDATRGQLLNLIGLIASAAIALSSATFVGNGMAGLMLSALRKMRPGDFIRVGEHFGRISEQGLLHTEIQTPERALVTLPNLHLVTNPVTVVRNSGTVVAATVSLGYDVARGEVERCLLEAARQADLEDPFVRIEELGDFSVSYRVAGFLEDVRELLAARSRLRAGMLDALHAGGIEIVSPSFMNQRQLDPARSFVPRPEGAAPARRQDDQPEDRIFDKADRAAAQQELERELAQADARIGELERQAAECDASNRAARETELMRERGVRAAIAARLEAASKTRIEPGPEA